MKMKKIPKKVIYCLLAAVMLTCCLPANVFADVTEDDAKTPVDYALSYTDSTATSSTVTLTNKTEESSNIRYILAAYSGNGRMVTCNSTLVTLDESASTSLDISYSSDSNVEIIKAFVLDGSTNVPLRNEWSKDAGDSETGNTVKENEIEVNGVSIYYETIGHGKPIILLHGNGGSHEVFTNLRNQLAEEGYLVYTPDSRGQGRNEPLDEYHYADMAEDMYCFIQELGIEKPALYGWSDGGITGLLLEINHPNTLSAMAISGANITPEGAGFSADMLEDGQSPLYKMMLLEPHITPEQLSHISIPVLVTAGEYDVILPEHTQLIADSLPNSELIIEEGEDHGSYILSSDKMALQLIDFLKRKYV